MPTLELKTDLILWKLTAQSQDPENDMVIFFDPFADKLLMKELDG